MIITIKKIDYNPTQELYFILQMELSGSILLAFGLAADACAVSPGQTHLNLEYRLSKE